MSSNPSPRAVAGDGGGLKQSFLSLASRIRPESNDRARSIEQIVSHRYCPGVSRNFFDFDCHAPVLSRRFSKFSDLSDIVFGDRALSRDSTLLVGNKPRLEELSIVELSRRCCDDNLNIAYGDKPILASLPPSQGIWFL